MKCGYCGKPVGSKAGTSQTGKQMRYYTCNGRTKECKCSLNPIRKEHLENVVTDITYEVLREKINISDLAERIFEIHKNRFDDQSLLNLLTADYTETEKSINNLLKAMEQGIITSSTKERLQQLEEKKAELAIKITAEQTRNKLLITKDEILQYLQNQVKKRQKNMIDSFVKKVVLYNDKIEIHYNYTEKVLDDDNSHQVFSFYEENKTFYINMRRYQNNHLYADNTGQEQPSTFNVILYI